jgi:anaerobic magnesium-protoporphyrin IX monomethyl ester cyclase
MRIALLYPPPWKIPEKGRAAGRAGRRAPGRVCDGDLDGDFFQTPYGLFAIGAQALRAGHQVKVFNLSGLPWRKVEESFARSTPTSTGCRAGRPIAEVWRSSPGDQALPPARARGRRRSSRDAVCARDAPASRPHRHRRDRRERAHISRASRPPAEARVARRDPGHGLSRRLAGAARSGAPAIEDLDSLSSAARLVRHAHRDDFARLRVAVHVLRRRSELGARVSRPVGAYVLDALEKAVARAPVKMIQIKDDTFTTNRKRVIALCRGIRERNINFLWSCDTRVDVLGEELLREMRLAGCERLSLGVESGSQKILDAIDKKITPDEIVASTELAKKYGIKLRYYMMLGNRGETRETFDETLRFLERARPHQYIFACLSVYPGTRDYDRAVEAGWLDAEFYFERDFQELKTTFDASDEDTSFFREWFKKNKGLREGPHDDVEHLAAVLDRLGDHHAAHVDLAGALYRDGRLDEAQEHCERALALGYPAPGPRAQLSRVHRRQARRP